jgi:DIS3-like exonuclease 2
MRLLRTHDICTEAYETDEQEPTENVLECLKLFAEDIDPETKEWVIPQSEFEARLDLRDKRIFTIDPLTARDLDDALSVEPVEGQPGVFEIGVHIADVSYFVREGTELDEEASKRCTSTYFVHQVYPMLPRLLCERLCSLNPKVDRLAYSIFFMMDAADGTLIRSFPPRISRSVIRTCAKWNYELVQKLLDGEITREDQLEEQ